MFAAESLEVLDYKVSDLDSSAIGKYHASRGAR